MCIDDNEPIDYAEECDRTFAELMEEYEPYCGYEEVDDEEIKTELAEDWGRTFNSDDGSYDAQDDD